MSDQKIEEQLNDFSVTLEMTVAHINKVLNMANMPIGVPTTEWAWLMNELQVQAIPQIDRARKGLEAVMQADKKEQN